MRTKPMPPGFKFSNTFFTRHLRWSAEYSNAYTDSGEGAVTGLMIEVSKRNSEITFRLRKRLNKEPRKRQKEKQASGSRRRSQLIGRFVPGTFGVAEARLLAGKYLHEWQMETVHGIKPKKPSQNCPTVLELRDRYEKARASKDQSTCMRGWKPLPSNWKDQMTNFNNILKPVHQVPVNELTREQLESAHTRYLDAREKIKGTRPERSITSMWSTIQPMFFWAVKKHWCEDEAVFRGFAGHSGTRTRILLPGEIQTVIPAAESMGDSGKFPLFLFWTLSRVGQAAGMKWSELQDTTLRTKEGTIPAKLWTVAGSADDEEDALQRRRLKGRDDTQADTFVIVGEALDIVNYFEAEKRRTGDDRDTVFPRSIAARWRDNGIKERAILHIRSQTLNWHCHDARRGATYLEFALQYAGYKFVEAQAIGKLALNHTMERGATVHYDFADVADEVGYALLIMQRLYRDMADGKLTDIVRYIQDERIPRNSEIRHSVTRYNLDPAHLKIKAAEPPRMAA